MKNYIDFTIDAASDSTLGNGLHEVVSAGSPQEVSSWMESRGYEVSLEESQKLVENSDNDSSIRLGLTY